jgi:hypothetical protein
VIRSSVRRAREQRPCGDPVSGGDCTSVIRPGEHYAITVASPHHDDYGNDGWLSMTACIPCARRYPVTWPPELLATATKPKGGAS